MRQGEIPKWMGIVYKGCCNVVEEIKCIKHNPNFNLSKQGKRSIYFNKFNRLYHPNDKNKKMFDKSEIE